MCAIVDANVAHEVFGLDPQPAGRRFFEWIEKGSERLVAGGRLLEELELASSDFRDWARSAILAGKMRIVDSNEMDFMIQQLHGENAHRSDDPHILALTRISGARLLYSNDKDLQRDFKNRRVIDNPRGSVYSTRQNKNFGDSHKRLLGRRDLCRAG